MVWQEQTDGVLLGAFLRTQDTLFLDELVRRHGKMVLGVCRRVAGSACAEDAAQIVFISMLRRAESLSTRAHIGGWLYRAAWNVASRARRDAAARRANEIQAARQRPQPVASEFADNTAAELHRALNLLPDAYRDAIILHHLEGNTIEQVSRILEAPVGTIAARLSRGRQMLRAQMEANGIVVSSATLAVILSDESPEAGCLLYVDWHTRSMAFSTVGYPAVAGSMWASSGVPAFGNPARTAMPVPGNPGAGTLPGLPPAGSAAGLPALGAAVGSGCAAAGAYYALRGSTLSAAGFMGGLKAACIAGMFMIGVPVVALGAVGAIGAVASGLFPATPDSGSGIERPVDSASEFDSAPDYSDVNGVPEPSTLLLIGPLASALLLRRRSRGGPLAADAR